MYFSFLKVTGHNSAAVVGFCYEGTGTRFFLKNLGRSW